MAQKLKKFEFKAPQRSGQSKYDWAKYLDGNIWQLQVGDDIELAPTKTKGVDDDDATRMEKTINQFAGRAKFVAATKGQEIRTQKVEGGIVLQAQGLPDSAKGAEFKAKQKALNEARIARKAAGTVQDEVGDSDDGANVNEEDAA